MVPRSLYFRSHVRCLQYDMHSCPAGGWQFNTILLDGDLVMFPLNRVGSRANRHQKHITSDSLKMTNYNVIVGNIFATHTLYG